MEIADLKKKHKSDIESANKRNQQEIKTLRRDKETLEKEIRASNATIQSFLDSLDGVKKRLVRED